MAKLVVSAELIQAALAGASACGVEVDPLLAQCGLEPERLRTGRMLSAKAERRLWKSLGEVGGESVGVRVALAMPRGSLGALEYAMRSAETVQRALEALQRYSVIWYGAPLFTLEPSSSGKRLLFHSPHPPQRSWAATSSEVALTAVARILHEMTRARGLMRSASIRFASGRSASLLAAELGVPIATRAERDCLGFPERSLEMPSLEADPRLHEVLVTYLGDQLRRSPTRDDAQAGARRAIAEALERGDVSIAPVARRLGVSARVLQTRLARSGTTFRRLLDEVRTGRAKSMLRRTDLPMALIAERLGYGDARSFLRGFKRTTGMTPSAYRAIPPEDRDSDPPSDRDVA